MSLFLIFLLLNLIQAELNESPIGVKQAVDESRTELIILGTLQDGGSPHLGCDEECCKDLFRNPDPDRMVVSLGLIDREHDKNYILEATPDLPAQLQLLNQHFQTNSMADGIFLTHAHIGHYTGLMYLGKEAMNAQQIPVFAMPRMKSFLENNGPWDQLISNQNISIQPLNAGKHITLTSNLVLVPLPVPHRDEYSETVGFKIIGPRNSALFIPDIDKWSKWDRDISEEISSVDYAFLDGTFFDGEELPNRDMSEIPHPFIAESMVILAGLDPNEKSKIHFIHFNHTNPVLKRDSKQAAQVTAHGFKLAQVGDKFEL